MEYAPHMAYLKPEIMGVYLRTDLVMTALPPPPQKKDVYPRARSWLFSYCSYNYVTSCIALSAARTYIRTVETHGSSPCPFMLNLGPCYNKAEGPSLSLPKAASESTPM